MITEPDYTLEQLVWSLTRDARDLRERVECGVKIHPKLGLEIVQAAVDIAKVLNGGKALEAAE